MSKEEVARKHMHKAERGGRSGVVMLGIAQEKAWAWRAWRDGGPDAHPHFEFARQAIFITTTPSTSSFRTGGRRSSKANAYRRTRSGGISASQRTRVRQAPGIATRRRGPRRRRPRPWADGASPAARPRTRPEPPPGGVPQPAPRDRREIQHARATPGSQTDLAQIHTSAANSISGSA